MNHREQFLYEQRQFLEKCKATAAEFKGKGLWCLGYGNGFYVQVRETADGIEAQNVIGLIGPATKTTEAEARRFEAARILNGKGEWATAMLVDEELDRGLVTLAELIEHFEKTLPGGVPLPAAAPPKPAAEWPFPKARSAY